jgi:hypothetical protein
MGWMTEWEGFICVIVERVERSGDDGTEACIHSAGWRHRLLDNPDISTRVAVRAVGQAGAHAYV